MAYRLIRHRPTLRWLPILLGATDVTPASAYFADLAARYQVPAEDLEGVEQEALPEDFETNQVPVYVPPPTPAQLEQQEARTLTLPTFAEIDALVDQIFPALTAQQRTFLKRLAKLVRVLAAQAGLG